MRTRYYSISFVPHLCHALTVTTVCRAHKVTISYTQVLSHANEIYFVTRVHCAREKIFSMSLYAVHKIRLRKHKKAKSNRRMNTFGYKVPISQSQPSWTQRYLNTGTPVGISNHRWLHRCGQWGVSPASVNSRWVELSCSSEVCASLIGNRKYFTLGMRNCALNAYEV